MSGNALPKHGHGVRLHQHRGKRVKPHPPMYSIKDLAERYRVTRCDDMVTLVSSQTFPKPAGKVFKGQHMVPAWIVSEVDQWMLANKPDLSTEKAKLSTG